MSSKSPFVYVEDIESLALPEDVVVIVPAGIHLQEKLFSILSKELNFPSYFGKNWNALYDCLSDFSWMNLFQITVIHHDLPALGKDATSIYLAVLADAIRFWKTSVNHQLRVVFPLAQQVVIEEILSDVYKERCA